MTLLLAHEWIAPAGGSENVFEQFRLAFPGSRAECLWNDAPDRFPEIRESWLARTPARRHKALALPLMDWAWGRVDLSGVERVLVSSHAFAHHLASRAAGRGIPSYAYVHTPARYLWDPDLDSRGRHALARGGRRWFRHLDRERVSPLVSYAANSNFVAERMARAWGVPSTVIYPPVEVEGIRRDIEAETWDIPAERPLIDGLPDLFVLGASRFVPYKRLESAIEVGEVLDLPVVLAGDGPHMAHLRSIAQQSRVPVVFVGRLSNQGLRKLYSRASLFVFTPVEDFGIMPVESIAAGTPVLVNRSGGAAESVSSIGGGEVADPDDRDDLKMGAQAALGLDMGSASVKAGELSPARFRERVLRWIGGGRGDEG